MDNKLEKKRESGIDYFPCLPQAKSIYIVNKLNCNPMKYPIIKLLILYVFISTSYAFAQKKSIPKVHSNIKSDNKGIYFELKGKKHYALPDNTGFNPEMFTSNIRGTKEGLSFDFKAKGLSGIMYYGFIPLNDSKYPHLSSFLIQLKS